MGRCCSSGQREIVPADLDPRRGGRTRCSIYLFSRFRQSMVTPFGLPLIRSDATCSVIHSANDRHEIEVLGGPRQPKRQGLVWAPDRALYGPSSPEQWTIRAGRSGRLEDRGEDWSGKGGKAR